MGWALLAPPGLGTTQEGPTRSLSDLDPSAPGASTAVPGLRDRPRPHGESPASFRRLGWTRAQALGASQVSSPPLPGSLSRRRWVTNPLSLKTILAPTWLSEVAYLPLHTSPMSSLSPPPHLLSTPEHTASRLPVTITREDKWPHSGTPCQICLSKTKLCAALREKRRAAARRAGGIGGCKLQGIC